MRIDYLRYLVAVAEKGSIRHAADYLFISPQGLSQAIQQLENQLGIPLLKRTGNRIYLTKEGLLTVEKSKELLQKYDEFVEAIHALTQDLTSEKEDVTFLLTPFFSGTNISDVIINFCIKNNNTNIVVNEKSPSDYLEELRRNPTAFGLYSVPSYKLKEINKELKGLKMSFEPFGECDGTVCVSKTSPLAKKKFISPGELINFPLAILELGQSPEFVYKVFEGLGKMNVVLKTTSAKVYHDTISSGLAVGFLNSFMANNDDNDSIVSIPLKCKYNWVLGWISPRVLEEDEPLLDLKKEIMKTVGSLKNHISI